MEADSEVAQEPKSSNGRGEDGVESISDGFSGRLMMSLSFTLRSLQLE